MFKHALCLHPYERDSHSGSLGLAVFPPTGLEYIAAALRPHVDRLTLVDMRLPGPLRNPLKLREFIAANVDLLCVSINWEYHFNEVCELVNFLPNDVMTVVGGKQATDNVEEIFAACPGVDVIVRGEGEDTIVDIARGVPLEDIAGISFRNGDELVHNPHRPLPDLESLPYPDRSLRSNRYRFNIGGVSLPGEEFDILLTSRGCPYNCKFCTFNYNPWDQKRRYSTRSIDSVMEELRQITAGIVLIADENFFVNPKRAKEICDRIVEEGIDKRFLVQSRLEIYKHPDVLEAAEKAGVKVILLGIESAQDRILEQLNKGFTTETVREAFKVLRQFPFYLHGYFIYGNITETEEEMLAIPGFARELGLDSITYQKLRIEKYSPLQELVDSTPGYFVGDDRIVYSEELGARPFLKKVSRRITRDFYTPAQVLKTARTVFRIKLLKTTNVPIFILSAPLVLGRAVRRKLVKGIRRKRMGLSWT